MNIPEPEDGWNHTIAERDANYLTAGSVTAVWCEQVDERKHILGTKYVYNCPMCGTEL